MAGAVVLSTPAPAGHSRFEDGQANPPMPHGTLTRFPFLERGTLHHHVAIHQWGWTVALQPDGTTTACSPDGARVLHSDSPPARTG